MKPLALEKIRDDARRVVDLGRRGRQIWRAATSLHAEGVAARARAHRARAQAAPNIGTSTRPKP
jgi:hypothetical protein